MTTNPSYVSVRSDLISLVPERWERLLDVGCAEGATSAVLRDSKTGRHVTGIEVDPTMAEVALQRLDDVLVGDAAECLSKLKREQRRFDVVLCGDVLEHLADPWSALRDIRVLCPSGVVIVSLPNVAHWSTCFNLLWSQRWPYRDRGIHDRTHLRFFARGNLDELFGAAGFSFRVARVRRRLAERPMRLNTLLEPLLGMVPVVRTLTEFQFLCVLR